MLRVITRLIDIISILFILLAFSLSFSLAISAYAVNGTNKLPTNQNSAFTVNSDSRAVISIEVYTMNNYEETTWDIWNIASSTRSSGGWTRG